MPYQAAKTRAPSATNGYLEQELSPGVFVIEVQQQRPSFSFINHQQHLLNLQNHWQKRAAEICPFGYQGQPDVIAPVDAQIEAFRCEPENCKQEPMISGVAKCHKRYQL